MRLIRLLKPDIVQTWLVHADFFGGIAARFAGIRCVIWNIRYTNFKIIKTKFTTLIIIKILAKLSSLIPKFIIINSKKAKNIYEISGYDKKKLKLIPNGYDLSELKISNVIKNKFRKKYNIIKKLLLIGNVARIKKKSFKSNRALSLINAKRKIFFFDWIRWVNKKNKILNSEKKVKFKKSCLLLGQKNNILEVMNGFDIYSEQCYGEGFLML